jgi:hypothetical protein
MFVKVEGRTRLRQSTWIEVAGWGVCGDMLLLLGVERGLFSKRRADGRLHCAVGRLLFEGVALVDMWEGGESAGEISMLL